MSPAALPRLPAARTRPGVPPGPYLVAGLRRAGEAAAMALLARGERVTVHDVDPCESVLESAARVERAGARVELGGDGAALPSGLAARTLVKSPGMPPAAPIVAAALGRGATVLDELELGWRLRREPVLAVTGTNGKSTVAGLLAAVLAAAGARAPLAGNTVFGPPLSGLAGEADAVVLEVSSFQLECCPALLPEAAVLTSFGHDHLYRHGTRDAYLAAKRSLFFRGRRAAPLAVCLADQPETAAIAAAARSRGARALTFGEAPDAEWRVTGSRTADRRGIVELAGPDGPLTLATRLPGPHNARNVAAAVALGATLGVPAPALVAAIEAFRGVPGRLDVVAERPLVVVDFAHNPDGLRAVLPTVRELAPPGARLLAVLAVPDIYDDGMAAAMGEAAAGAADVVHLTTERWRESDLAVPRPALVAGARAAGRAELRVIGDRGAAALAAAGEGDAIALLGRGPRSAPLFSPDGERLDATDAELARQALGEP